MKSKIQIFLSTFLEYLHAGIFESSYCKIFIYGLLLVGNLQFFILSTNKFLSLFINHNLKKYIIEKEINKDAKFVVFHDAYQYFEERFETRAAGALTLNTDVLPGAKQIADIQDVIKDRGIKCIFSEPQFNPKLINMIAKSSGAETGILDPLGSSYKPGKNLYFNLINDLYENLNKCQLIDTQLIIADEY